jgi:hypothetical protein
VNDALGGEYKALLLASTQPLKINPEYVGRGENSTVTVLPGT